MSSKTNNKERLNVNIIFRYVLGNWVRIKKILRELLLAIWRKALYPHMAVYSIGTVTR